MSRGILTAKNSQTGERGGARRTSSAHRARPASPPGRIRAPRVGRRRCIATARPRPRRRRSAGRPRKRRLTGACRGRATAPRLWDAKRTSRSPASDEDAAKDPPAPCQSQSNRAQVKLKRSFDAWMQRAEGPFVSSRDYRDFKQVPEQLLCSFDNVLVFNLFEHWKHTTLMTDTPT